MKTLLHNIKKWLVFSASIDCTVSHHAEIERIQYFETRTGLINILIHYKNNRVDNFLTVKKPQKISFLNRNGKTHVEKI